MDMTATILRQYRAPLAMLRKAIELCPADLWLEGDPNRFWHIAYHALFYTHFYLSPAEADFVPWEKSRANYNYLGGAPWRPNERFNADEPYTQSELLEFAGVCGDALVRQVPSLNLEAESGFHWLAFDKLELQLYNIRHLQHHTGQLIERLRSRAGIGVGWVG